MPNGPAISFAIALAAGVLEREVTEVQPGAERRRGRAERWSVSAAD